MAGPSFDPNNATDRRIRIGGSGYTYFEWQSQRIAFVRQSAHTSPAPVGPGAVPIHPLDAAHPIQIITPAATSMGQIVLDRYERYGTRIWDDLLKFSNLNQSDTLQEVFVAVANSDKPISLVKHIVPPAGSNVDRYRETYHNCVITNIQDGETIEVGTMEILKQITVAYTHYTHN